MSNARCLMGVCSVKVRVIVCKQLASLLGYVDKPTPPMYEDVARTDLEDHILDHGFTNHVEPAPPPAARMSALSDPVLISIRDLLQRRADREEEERMRSNNESNAKRDWTLAARVVNRLSFFFFITTLFVVSAAFFIVFHMHH